MSLLSAAFRGINPGLALRRLGTLPASMNPAKLAANRAKRTDALGALAGAQSQNAPPDPYEQAQKAALDRMKQISEGGETEAEKAQRMALQQQRQQAYAEGRQQLQGQMASGFEANKANMARRGIASGGAEIAQNAALQQNLGNAMGRLAGEQSGQEAQILADQGMQAQQRRMAATQALSDIAQGKQAQDISKLGMASNMWNAMQGRKQNRYLAQQQMMGQAIGGLSAGAGYAAFSDENVKTGVKEQKNYSTKMVSEFMEPLKSYNYKYKDSKYSGDMGDKTYSSVMAQDLEKSKLGRQMVIDTPEGKMVDYAKGIAPIMSSIAELNQRLKRLET